MLNHSMKHLIYAGVTTIFTMTVTSAEIPASLNGASGNIFRVDLKAQTFELLKETEYDPKTDIGKSRFTIHWNEKIQITKTTQLLNFAEITEPMTAEFYAMNPKNAEAAAAGNTFQARRVILSKYQEHPARSIKDVPSVLGKFTPGEGKNPRNGTIELDGKAVSVSMQTPQSQIILEEPIQVADLTKGLWKATLQGEQDGEHFIVESMKVTELEDPRAKDDSALPRVLVIGDSISMNYHEAATAALKGIANYHRNEGNSFSSVHGVNNAELWLGDYQQKGQQWDVIQFNHGLHDLKQSYDKTTDSFSEYAVPLETYKQSLEKEIAILKKTGAILIWCSTTPVPKDNKSQYARRKGVPALFNQAAAEVMQRHPEILINDLHGVVSNSPVYDNWRKGIDVHFYQKQEQELLGSAVAEAVKSALNKKKKPLLK
jgi:hypothetical protein